MATFNVNQNNQWYTVLSVGTKNTSPTNAGEIALYEKDGKQFFMYNHYGEINDLDVNSTLGKCKRSEIIEHPVYLKYTPYEAFAKRKQWVIQVKSGATLANTTHVLTLTVPSYQQIGEYRRNSFTVDYTGGTASDLFKTYAKELSKCIDLVGPNGMIDVAIDELTQSDFTAYAANTSYSTGDKISNNDKYYIVMADITSTDNTAFTDLTTEEVELYCNLIITEKEDQKWRRGAMFNDYVTLLYFAFENVVAGTSDAKVLEVVEVSNPANFVTTVYNAKNGEIDSNSTSIAADFKYRNAQEIADMEYFYLGEHGDQQRDQGFPYNIHKPTGYYKVSGEAVQEYDLIQLHHYYTGNGTFVHKSEMDITFAVPNDGSHTVAKALWTLIKGSALTDATSPEIYNF